VKRCPYCAEEIQDAATVCKHCGRDLKFGTALITKWETEARELLRTGKTIEAIKIVREGTGLDLKGAKDLVDGWRRQDPTAFPAQSGGKGIALGCVVVIALLAVIAYFVYRSS
jgi:hypothetical protein